MNGATMIVGVIVVAAVALGLLGQKYDYFAWDRQGGHARLLKQTQVQPDKLPALAKAMANGTASVRYASLIFTTPDRPSDEDALNIQMSFENGTVGFDWVLLAPRNIEDQDEFRTFAREEGVKPIAHSENGVSYLRVEGVDAAKFTGRVLTRMYHHPSNEPLGLVYEGFEWPQS